MTACPQTAPVHRAHWDSTKGRIREIQTGGLERPSRGKWEPDVKKTGRGHDPGATLGTCPCLVKGKILVKGKLPPKTFSRHRETGSGQVLAYKRKSGHLPGVVTPCSHGETTRARDLALGITLGMCGPAAVTSWSNNSMCLERHQQM